MRVVEFDLGEIHRVTDGDIGARIRAAETLEVIRIERLADGDTIHSTFPIATATLIFERRVTSLTVEDKRDELELHARIPQVMSPR